LPLEKAIGIVEIQQRSRDLSDFCNADNMSSLDAKVLCPDINARIKESAEMCRSLRNRSNVAALVAVTENACERQV